MTTKQIYKTICAFVGDYAKAQRYTRIFIDNALVPYRAIDTLTLCYGKFSAGGNYHGENRDTVHFTYTAETEPYPLHFSILE